MTLAVFAVFAAMLGLFPFFTPYLVDLGADASLAGTVVATYSLANLAGNALGGWASDRFGRRLPLVAGLAGAAVTLLGYLVPRLPVVALSHAAHGLAAGVVVPAAFAWVGDGSLVAGRGRAMGRLGMAIGLAAVLAPLAGGVLARRVGEAGVFVLLAGLLAAAAVVAARQPRPRVAARDGRQDGPRPGRWLSRELVAACVAAFALQLGFGFIVWLLPLQARSAGLGSPFSGALMGLLGGVAAAGMALGGRLSDRRGRWGLMAAGLGWIAAGLVLLGAVPSGQPAWRPASVAGSVAFGTGFGLLFPACTALVADATPPAARGAAFSLFYVTFSLGTMAAPAVGSWWLAPGPGVGIQLAGTPYLLGAAVAVAAAAWVLWEARARPAPARPPRGPALS